MRALGSRWRVEARTGDTASSVRARQRAKPPEALVTTPESLSLMLARAESEQARLVANRADAERMPDPTLGMELRCRLRSAGRWGTVMTVRTPTAGNWVQRVVGRDDGAFRATCVRVHLGTRIDPQALPPAAQAIVAARLPQADAQLSAEVVRVAQALQRGA